MNYKKQIFISSQMKHGTLNAEREVVRKVIKGFDHFAPWDWENEGPAGARTPMEYCLNQVNQSYGLVLIVSQTLTNHTFKEFNLAIAEGIHVFTFFKKGRQRGQALKLRKRLKNSYLEFQNKEELETLLHRSLRNHIQEALTAYKVPVSNKTPSYIGRKS